MSAAAIQDLLDAAADAAGRLGVDIEAEIGGVREFLAGPPAVALVGVPHQERHTLAMALTEELAGAAVRELAPGQHVMDLLWDVLVLVTPADRALSSVEEALVRAAVEKRRPVLVVLSRVHALGANPAAAIAEVERFRLRPALGMLDVRWYVDDTVTRAAIVADITTRLRVLNDHNPAGKLALRAILDRVIARFDEVRAAREQALALLSTIEGQLPASLTHLHELSRLNRMAVADRLRTVEDGLYDGAIAAADAALEWATAEGIAPWADIERPVRQAWQRLVDGTRQVLPEHAELLREGLVRTRDNLVELISRLQIEVSAPAMPSQDWHTPATSEAIALLLDVDIEPVLQRFEREARGQLPKEDARDSDSEGPVDNGTAASVARRSMEVGKRLQAEVQRRTANTAYNPLRLGLHADLQAVTRRRIAHVHEVLREAAAAGGTAATGAAAQGQRAVVAQAAEAVHQRHAWHGAYGELLSLRARS